MQSDYGVVQEGSGVQSEEEKEEKTDFSWLSEEGFSLPEPSDNPEENTLLEWTGQPTRLDELIAAGIIEVEIRDETGVTLDPPSGQADSVVWKSTQS